MRISPTLLPLLALAALLLPSPVPAAAQDGCGDGCSEIEVNDGGDDEEKTRKKNSGLAGGGPKEKGDKGAPKLKMNLQQQVNLAVKRGVAWLKRRQNKDGSYGPCHSERKYGGGPGGDAYFSGPTSFALYTLAKCGVSRKDAVMKKGYRWLSDKYRKSQMWVSGRKTGPKDTMVTYEISSLILMLEAMHEGSAKLTGKHNKKRLHTDNPFKLPSRSRFPKEDWRWMHAGIVYLTSGKPGGGRKGVRFAGCQNATGGWRYGQANRQEDMSATQFVLLGLRSASQAGYPVKTQVWRRALDYVRSMVSADGSSPYQKSQQWSAGMTAAAAASAIICREQLELAGEEPPGFVDDLIKRALSKLDQVFDVARNQGGPHRGAYHFYYLYGVERIGDLTGRREFNGKDWYVRGARFLIANQDAGDGKWVDSTCMKPKDVLGTCFALLFLKRATVPTVTISGN